jgi:hypothetical protein
MIIFPLILVAEVPLLSIVLMVKLANSPLKKELTDLIA